MRVRFAPSPTGTLHIGGARTALYNWLLARKHGGTFVLRIEDTDRERSTPENVEQIYDALRWLELDWDEGPYSQAERIDRHKEEIARLYDEAHTFFTTPELIEAFSLERVGRSPAVFDEQKLRWMNGRYLREMDPDELTRLLEERLGRTGLREAVGIAQEKMQTLDDFWRLAGFLVEPQPIDEKAWAKVMRDGAAENLARARGALASVEPFDQDGVETALRELVDELGVKGKDVYQPVRVAISGSTVSPGIFESVALLGREETLRRIDSALAKAR